MKTKLLIACLSIAFVVASCGKKGGTDGPKGENQEIELKLNLPKGKTYKTTMNSDLSMEMNIKGLTVTTAIHSTAILDCEVKDVLANGNMVVRHTYKSIKMNGETKGTPLAIRFDYDSETGKVNGIGGEAVAEGMKKLINTYFDAEFDKTGKIIATTSSTGENKTDQLHFHVLPDKKVKVGDTWESDIDQKTPEGVAYVVKAKFKLESVQDGIATVSIDGTATIKESEKGADVKLTGTQKGSFKIDIATGLTKETTVEQVFDTEVAERGEKMPMKLTNKMTITSN